MHSGPDFLFLQDSRNFEMSHPVIIGERTEFFSYLMWLRLQPLITCADGMLIAKSSPLNVRLFWLRTRATIKVKFQMQKVFYWGSLICLRVWSSIYSAEALCRELKIKDYILTSAKEGTNVDKAFTALAQLVCNVWSNLSPHRVTFGALARCLLRNHSMERLLDESRQKAVPVVDACYYEQVVMVTHTWLAHHSLFLLWCFVHRN